MNRSVRRVLLLGFLSIVVYPLSFAPVDLILYGPSSQSGLYRLDRMQIYSPVNYLIDHTPLAPPLLWWSNVWCVGDRHRLEQWLRKSGYSGTGHGGNISSS